MTCGVLHFLILLSVRKWDVPSRGLWWSCSKAAQRLGAHLEMFSLEEWVSRSLRHGPASRMGSIPTVLQAEGWLGRTSVKNELHLLNIRLNAGQTGMRTGSFVPLYVVFFPYVPKLHL